MSSDKDIKTYLDALERLKKYCAYQDRCHFEVEQKLKEYSLTEDQKLFIYKELIEQNFLDEKRFVEAFISGKFNIKGWGKRKIAYELKMKKIHSKLIEEALESIDNEEYLNKLNELYLKKLKSLKGNKNAIRQKTIKYLIQRGYDYSIIREVIENNEL